MGAGLERFHSQAAGIALDIEAFGADQAIGIGIVGALGYPRNKRAFRAVATRASWEFLSAYDRPSEIERLLMHAAGLEATAGENNSTGSHLSSLRTMIPRGSPPDWVRPWGRPANAPATRIKAIAELVPIWASNGGIASVCRRAVEAASNAKDLASTFRPQELVRSDDATVIGAARADEIVVNISPSGSRSGVASNRFPGKNDSS